MTQTPAADIMRLREGVREVGLADDNNTELFDIEDANERMHEAATEIERLYTLAKANNDLARLHSGTIEALRAREAELKGFDLIPEGEHAKALTRIDALQRKLDEVVKAKDEALTLIDEMNERGASRRFYGIDQTLHAKICTIRATLVRYYVANAPRRLPRSLPWRA